MRDPFLGNLPSPRPPGTVSLVTTNTHLESHLESTFRTAVRTAGGLCFKVAPIDAGLPDRLVVFPGGRIFLVELKAESGELRPIQRVMHSKLAARGTEVVVLTGADEVASWVAATAQPSTCPRCWPSTCDCRDADRRVLEDLVYRDLLG